MTYSETLKILETQCGNAKIMAVSKTRTLEEIQMAYKAGFRLFGENHVQEIVEKFTSWHPSDVQVHMIGHLQSNKINKVVPLVDMIQSVDSYELLVKINSCAERNNKIMPVLLEVNTSEEAAKSGFHDEQEVISCIEKSAELRNIEIKGFMTVGPIDHSYASRSFKKLVSLRDKCTVLFKDMAFAELSMGMSQDYDVALREGSTLVRIGTLIFGQRDYSKH